MEDIVRLSTAGLRLLITITTLFYGSQLFKKHGHSSIRTVNFAAGVLFSTGLISLIQGVILILNPHSIEALQIRISVLDGVIGVISAFFLILITSYFEENRVASLKILISASLGTLTISSLLVLLIPDLPLILTYASFSFILFFGYTVVILYRSLRRLSSHMNPEQQSITQNIRVYLIGVFGDLTLVYLVTTIIFIFDIAEAGTDFYNIVISISLIVPSLILLVGNFFFYRGFVRPENPAFLQPQIQNKFILMNKQGTPFFEYDFGEAQSIDGVLISGALTAISAVLKEATNVGGELQQVKIGDQYLIVEVCDEVIGVLFTDHPTVVQSEVLSRLMDDISNSKDLSTTSISKQQDEFIQKQTEYHFGISLSLSG